MSKEYKYVSNKDAEDRTEYVSVPGGTPIRQGETVKLTHAEYELLEARINLEEVETKEDKNVTQDSDNKSETDK